MSRIKTPLIATALVAALLGASATAIAQGMAPELLAQHTAQRMNDATVPHMHGARHASMSERMERHRSERLTQLKQALNLTPEQEPAWNAFVARTAPADMPMPRLSKDEWRQLSTPERLDRMATLRDARHQAMTKRMDATRSFYGALTSEQQKVFDEKGMGSGMGRHVGHRMHGKHRDHAHRAQQGMKAGEACGASNAARS